MIRILFIILAVVSAVLAIVLEQPVLYGVAAVLVVLAFVLLIVVLKRQHRRAKEPYVRSAAPAVGKGSGQDEDLASLGILEIRPRGAASVQEEPREERAAQEEATKVAEEAGEPVSANGTHAPFVARVVRDRPRTTHVAPDATAEEQREALMLSLRAVRSAVDAQTVCLLRQEEYGSQHYDIEAIVSLNAYARTGGHFTARTPLLTPLAAQRTVTVRRVGETGIPASSLAYYREAIAVRQIAMAPVDVPGAEDVYFLLADTMQEGGLGAAWQRTMLAQFARVFGTFLSTQEAGEIVADTELRPRRDIIGEEMARAREEDRPLALAIVYLNRAEAMADGEASEMAVVEEALGERLRASMERGRVERFGELTYGVFYPGGGAEVERWAVRLQHELAGETGPLEGGVSIGIALLKERHAEPEDLRADATEALREAYETGTCTILE